MAETPVANSEHTSIAPADGAAPELSPARQQTQWLRLRGAMVLVPCALLLIAAVTKFHHKAYLPPCSMRTEYGLPCPSCGMTRSVEAMAAGEIGRASELQPFGVVLYAAAAFFGMLGLMELVTGRDLIGILRPSLWWVLYGVGGMIVGWLWVLLAGLISGRLPIK